MTFAGKSQNSDPIRVDAAITVASFIPCVYAPLKEGKTILECVFTIIF